MQYACIIIIYIIYTYRNFYVPVYNLVQASRFTKISFAYKIFIDYTTCLWMCLNDD